MVEASYSPEGALMVVVRSPNDQVIAEGRVLRPEGETGARVSWWPTGEHEILPRTARQQGIALIRLSENAEWLDSQHFAP